MRIRDYHGTSEVFTLPHTLPRSPLDFGSLRAPWNSNGYLRVKQTEGTIILSHQLSTFGVQLMMIVATAFGFSCEL